MNLFSKKEKYFSLEPQTDRKKSDKKKKEQGPSIPNGMWIKCNTCKMIIYKKEITEYKLCPSCGAHFRMTPAERIAVTCDEGSFQEFDADMIPENPMEYPDYDRIVGKAQDKTGLREAVVTGRCRIEGNDAVIAIMDSHFMMGSMGSVVGEKITRAVEYATQRKASGHYLHHIRWSQNAGGNHFADADGEGVRGTGTPRCSRAVIYHRIDGSDNGWCYSKLCNVRRYYFVRA